MSDLKKQILDKLAKEYFISVNPDILYKSWKQMKEDFAVRAISLPEVEKTVELALSAKQTEKFELTEHYHKQAQEYKKLYKIQWEKCGNYVREIQALELRLKTKQIEVLKEVDVMIKKLEDQLKNPNPDFEIPVSGWAYRKGAEDELKNLKKRLLAKEVEEKE